VQVEPLLGECGAAEHVVRSAYCSSSSFFSFHLSSIFFFFFSLEEASHTYSCFMFIFMFQVLKAAIASKARGGTHLRPEDVARLDDECYIPADDIDLGERLGGGGAGSVHKGLWLKKYPVAVKQVRFYFSLYSITEYSTNLILLFMINNFSFVRSFMRYNRTEVTTLPSMSSGRKRE